MRIAIKSQTVLFAGSLIMASAASIGIWQYQHLANGYVAAVHASEPGTTFPSAAEAALPAAPRPHAIHPFAGLRYALVLQTLLLGVGCGVLVSAGIRLRGRPGAASDIAERADAPHAALMLAAIFEATTDFVVQFDRSGKVSYMNPAARRCAGLSADALLNDLTMTDLAPGVTVELMQTDIVPMAAADGVWVGESLIWDALRNSFPVSNMVIAHRDRHRKVERFSAIMRDISAPKAIEQALQDSEARLRTIADALPMRVAYVDANACYRFVNHACESLLEMTREKILGRTVEDVLGLPAYRTIEQHIKAALRGEHVVFRSRRPSGSDFVHDETHCIPQHGADGSTVVGFHAVTTDITRQKRKEHRLLELASHDALTGLENRAAFERRVAEAMARGRERGSVSALLYLDIDHFKQVNDRHGHLIGDALLKSVAGRISQAVGLTGFAARIGGDEFNVLMEDLANAEAASRVAHDILCALNAPFELKGLVLQVGTSIGVAFHSAADATAEQWIREADDMLYRAKGAGRNNVQMAEAPASLRA